MPVRSITIQRAQAGCTVSQVLREALHLARSAVLQHLRDKKVRLAGHLCRSPGRRVRPGQRLEVVLTSPNNGATRKPRAAKRTASPSCIPTDSPLAQAIRVRYVDSHVLVVNKPAGLTTVRHASEVEDLGRRAQKFLPPTLVDLLPR